MIYNILLVDDEPLIVDTISQLLSEHFPDMLDIVHAYSALDAIQIMHHRRIDILISDISMPGMSGLQLVRVVREYWPSCCTMLVTAYANFEYAKEAVHLGVSAYVLKSDSDKAIVDAFNSCVNQFNNSLKRIDILQNISSNLEQAQSILRGNALWTVLHSLNEDDIRSLLTALGFRDGGEYRIAICMSGDININELFLMISRLSHHYLDIPIAISNVVCHNDLIVWLWQTPTENKDDFIHSVSDAYELLGQHLSESVQITTCYYISRSETDIAKLPEVFSQCESHARRLHDGQSGSYICQIDHFPFSSGDRLLKSVEEYIKSHITEDISLSDIAFHVGYSPSYLSRLYMKSTGTNISDVVCKCKYDVICSMMANATLSFAEIAEKCGFVSQSYFNRFVKRMSGLTPGQLRERILTKENTATN